MLQSLQFAPLCLPNATCKTCWESLIVQRQMKRRQTIKRENKINNKHQAGAMVRFSSLFSSSSTVSLTGWMEDDSVIPALTPQLCHCDNRTDSWLTPITSYGRASIKESLWKSAAPKSSWTEFLLLCLFLHFWRDSRWVRPKISVEFLVLDQFCTVFEILCGCYAMNWQLVQEVTYVCTITAGTDSSNSTSLRAEEVVSENKLRY